MEKEISELEQEISKSINEVAKELELKYRDFVPSYICLAECQEKIQSALQNGKEKLRKMELQLANVEKSISKIKEDPPHNKLEIVQDFIERLAILSEIEQCLNTLWLLPTENKLEFDPLANTRTILRLEELCATLESESANYMETINERILPLLFVEIQMRKSELCQLLSDFYSAFLRFYEDDRVMPTQFVMCITCPNTKAASDVFSAMHRLGMLEERIEAMVDAVWEQFCLKLIYSAEPHDKLLKVHEDKFADHTIIFGIKKDVEMSKKAEPSAVFRSLTNFFDSFQSALKGIQADDRMLIDIFGETISAQLIATLEKGCLAPAIPFEKQQAATIYGQLQQLTKDFMGFMQEKGFFAQPVDHLFENFFDSFERVSVDRRCHHFITTARELIKKPHIDLLEVGSAVDDKEEKSADILAKMEEKLRIKPDNEDASLPTSTKWDKYYTKIFQFRRCRISSSTFELINLLHEVLRAAAEADSDLEACRLITTARNMLEMFVTLAPDYHRVALTSVPQIAAVFFNNCHYIVHRLMTLPADIMQNILKVSKVSEQDCAFTDMFLQLRTLAASILEKHIVQARRQLSATIGEEEIFVGLRDDRTHKRCVKLLNACMMQIEQTAAVWREVFPSLVLMQCLGELVSHMLALMVESILSKEDIASSDAEIAAELLTTLIDRSRQLMMIDGQPTIQKVCEEPYYKLQEIIFCLKGNLAEIGHRWCEGTGPLALWLKPAQVKHLIRALFQNTDRRAQLLAQIN